MFKATDKQKERLKDIGKLCQLCRQNENKTRTQVAE